MKKITYILLSACFLLTSCEDFLNRDPDAKVGSGDYFTDEGSLLTYINGFIQKYTPSAADLGYGDGYSDIMATEKSFTFLTNASWTPDLQSGWSISNWTPIYNINYFLVHMREAKGALRSYLQPLRRHSPFLARMAVFREGQDLRCRTLVRRTDRPRRHGGALQTARQP